MKYLYAVIALLFFIPGKGQMSPSTLHRVVVEEMIQTKAYTYLRVKEDSKENWLAAPKMTPVIGAVYYYLGEMEMKNFESKELSRTFDSVTFVEDLVFEEIYKEGKYPVKGGTTIANLYINKNDYDGKLVKVRGKVTKYNDNIMGKNWIHLNDGTNSLGNRDFVITSKMETKVGDVITVEGKLSIHVDLGSGYRYEVMIEEAKVLE
jgi:hypothetical protein